MQSLFINDLIQLYCVRHVSNNQVFSIRKTSKFYTQTIHTTYYNLSMIIYREVACASLPDDEHLVVV